MTTTGGFSDQYMLVSCSGGSTLWLSWALPPGGTSGSGFGTFPPLCYCRAGVQALGEEVDGATHHLTMARRVLPLAPHMQLKCFKPAISSSLSHYLSLERKCQ